MIKRMIYYTALGFIVLFIMSLFTTNKLDSLISGVSTGFSLAIGQIIAQEYIFKKGVSHIEEKIKK